MSASRHKSSVRILFKTILRLHRGLPEDLRLLGTSYVKDEFKRHKDCDPALASVFLTQWAEYATTLARQLGLKGPKTAKKIGIPLNVELLESMREEQIVQLYELMKASTNEIETAGIGMNFEEGNKLEERTHGTGDGALVDFNQLTTADGDNAENTKENPKAGSLSRTSTPKKGSSLGASFKKLVRGRSKTRNETEEIKDLVGAEASELDVKGANAVDSKKTFSKLLQSLNMSRSGGSRTDMRHPSGEVTEGGHRAGELEEEEEGEAASAAAGGESRGGTLGRIFGRRSHSRTALGPTPSSDLFDSGQKGGTLGRLFRRRSSSRTEVCLGEDEGSPSPPGRGGKSGSLGRRLGTSLFSSFHTSRREQASSQGAP